MRAAMAMALCWQGLSLLLLLLLLEACSMPVSTAATTLPSEGLKQQSQHFFISRHLRQRSLLQTATPPIATASPPIASASPPIATASPPIATTSPPIATASPPVATASAPPSPPPRSPPAPPTPVRSYLMWVGIGAAMLVFASVATFCLCRKFGQNKVRGAQRLPPLPRYH